MAKNEKKQGKTQPRTKRIGFIGLGSMGSKIAGRLLAQGFPLVVYNRTAEKMEPFLAQGAERAASPRELAAAADVVITVVTNDDAVRAVVAEEEGAFAGARQGTAFIDISTISVGATQALSEEAARRGLAWLDAPTLGNPAQAEAGELPLVVGGAAETLAAQRDVLEAISAKIVHMGGPGLGQAAKILHNLTCGIALVAYSEALVLGDALGIPRPLALEVLLNGATASKLLTIKAAKWEADAYVPTMAPLENMRKDLALAEAAAALADVTLPALQVAKDLYDRAVERGLSREDTSSVIKMLKDN